MKKRGSITVEAAVVMPIVLAVSIIMVYFLLIHYERTVLSSFCYNFAEAVAKYSNAKYTKESTASATDTYFYQDKIAWKKDLATEKYRYPIYWRGFSDYIPSEAEANNKIKKAMIFRQTTSFKIEKETGFLSSYIIVSGERRVKEIIPILRFLGIQQDGVKISSTARVPISDQPELIRNIGLLQDGVRLVPGAGKVIDDIKSSLKESLDSLLE